VRYHIDLIDFTLPFLLSFFLTSLLAPMGAANFFLLGTKLFYGRERQEEVEKMLEGRPRGLGGFVTRALGGLQMLAFDGGVRTIVGLLRWNPFVKSELTEFCVFVASSFLLSLKVLSVYTCTTQGGSFARHVLVAIRSPFVLIGFGAPLELLRFLGGGGGLAGVGSLTWEMLDMGLYFCIGALLVGRLEGWERCGEKERRGKAKTRNKVD
jgi:hypothetical protein